jgi:DNA-binding XRE family transcriptional regulator
MLISKIGELINNSGLKRKYIANKLEVTYQTLSNWCAGSSFPNMITAFKLSRLLGVTVEDLYEYKEDEHETKPNRSRGTDSS